MRFRYLSASPIAAFAILAAACGSSSSSSTSLTSPTQTISTDVLTGTVQPPVDGVRQSSFNAFTVGQGGGTVQVTLTSAVETLPDGSLLPTVTVGLGVGSATNGTCTLLANAFAIAQAGSSPQLTGSLSAGSYCVEVSDVTNQLGSVSYAVAVAHP